MKNTWKIKNEEIEKTKHAAGIKSLVIGSNVIMNQNKIQILLIITFYQ